MGILLTSLEISFFIEDIFGKRIFCKMIICPQNIEPIKTTFFVV